MKTSDNLGLHLFEGTDPVSLKKINENTELLDREINARVRTSVGSYVGTGEATAALSFDFEPELVLIQNSEATTYPLGELVNTSGSGVISKADKGITLIKGCASYLVNAAYIVNENNGYVRYSVSFAVEFNGTGVEWSVPETYLVSGVGNCPVDPASLFNADGVVYHYFAIGRKRDSDDS